MLEALAPKVRDGVQESERVLLLETVAVDVPEPVPLPLLVGVPLPVPEGVAGGVALLLMLALPELEGDTPRVSEAVADTLTVLLPLRVEVGDTEGVPEPEGVALPVGVPVPLGEAVSVEESEMLPVVEALAPGVRGGVCEALVVLLLLTVELEVMLPVPVGVPLEVGVGVPLSVDEADWVEENERVGVTESEALKEGAGV